MTSTKTEKAIKKVMERVAQDRNSVNIGTIFAKSGDVTFKFWDVDGPIASFSLSSIIGKRYAKRKAKKVVK